MSTSLKLNAKELLVVDKATDTMLLLFQKQFTFSLHNFWFSGIYTMYTHWIRIWLWDYV